MTYLGLGNAPPFPLPPFKVARGLDLLCTIVNSVLYQFFYSFIYKQAALEAEDEVQQATEHLAREVLTWGDILQAVAYIADTMKGKASSKKKDMSLFLIWSCLRSAQLPLSLAQVSILIGEGKHIVRAGKMIIRSSVL